MVFSMCRIAEALVFRGSCVILDCDHSRAGRVSGLNRESGDNIGFGPFGMLWLLLYWLVLVSGTAGFRRFRMSADCVQSAELSVSMN